jgi:sporulation protein YlmC with PRC-barrel domain
MWNRRCVMTIVAICGMAGSVYAQEQPDRNRSRPENQQPSDQPRKDGDKVRVKEHTEKHSEHTDKNCILVPSTRAEGVTVVGADDVRLGMVKDAIVRGNSGRVVYVLVSRGMTPAYSQTPDRVVAVPFAALTWDDERRVLTVPITEAKFNAAMSTELDKWNTLRDPTIATNTYKYFAVPDDRADLDRRVYRVRRDRMNDDMDSRRDRMNDKDKDARDRDARKEDQQARDREARRDRANDADNLSRTDAEGSLFRVSEIRNKPLMSRDGEEVALVNDLVFDAPSGHVAFLVITPSSTMNAGDGRIAVPWPNFEVDQTGRLYADNLDKETLRAAPRFTQAEWAELHIDGYNDDVYKRFGYPAPQWERSTTVKTTTSTTSSTTNTRPANTDPNNKTPAMQGDWRGPYTKAMATGTPRTVNGRIESITEYGTDPKIVVINVKTDDGEVVPIHLAPRSHLDKHSLKLKQGETVTVSGKDISLDGKKCVCGTEVTSNGDRVTIYTDK